MNSNEEESKKWFDKGVQLAEENKFEESLDCFNKAIELKSDCIDAWYNKGCVLFSLGRKEEALEAYEEVLKRDTNYLNAWYNKGVTLDDLGHKEEALEAYEEALMQNPNFVYAWNAKGIVLASLGRIEEALNAINKSLEINSEYATTWYNKGVIFYDLGKKEKALEAFNKVIELKDDYIDAWYNKGNILREREEYKEALKCYDKVLLLNPNFTFAWGNKGNILNYFGEYEAALACHKEAIRLIPSDALSWSNKGNALFGLNRKEAALESYSKAIELSPDYVIAWNNKGIVLVELERFKEAAHAFIKAKIDILDLIVKLKYETEDIVKKVIHYMLEEDDFFNQIISEETQEREKYTELYFQSLYIISLLHVNKDEEPLIAHYTSKKVSELLIFEANKALRFYSVITSNDPKEGQSLLDALFQRKNGKDCFKDFIRQESYRAFAGCFTFNEEHLNQFRLYGKDENSREATGVSLLLNPDYFSSSIKRSMLMSLKDGEDKSSEETKLPLFRCMYIDPNTGFLASIGQREEYTFHRNNNKKKYASYKKEIDRALKEVRRRLKELKEYIEENKLDEKLVCKLLINLRYLTKHVAFKEEQECRVIRIEPITEKYIGVDGDRLYIEYLPIRSYVEKICFAPKTEGMELYHDKLKHFGYKIECGKCDHPFS